MSNKKPRFVRLAPHIRQSIIEQAAVDVANDKGLVNVNYDTVSEACSISTSRATVKYHYPLRDDLYSLVLESQLEVHPKVFEDAELMGLVSE